MTNCSTLVCIVLLSVFFQSCETKVHRDKTEITKVCKKTSSCKTRCDARAVECHFCCTGDLCNKDSGNAGATHLFFVSTIPFCWPHINYISIGILIANAFRLRRFRTMATVVIMQQAMWRRQTKQEQVMYVYLDSMQWGKQRGGGL